MLFGGYTPQIGLKLELQVVLMCMVLLGRGLLQEQQMFLAFYKHFYILPTADLKILTFGARFNDAYL